VDVIARAGDIAEEVGLALGARRVELGRLVAQPHEDLRDGVLDPGFLAAETIALDVTEAGLFQIAKLADELFQAEGALQCPQKIV